MRNPLYRLLNLLRRSNASTSENLLFTVDGVNGVDSLFHTVSHFSAFGWVVPSCESDCSLYEDLLEATRSFRQLLPSLSMDFITSPSTSTVSSACIKLWKPWFLTWVCVYITSLYIRSTYATYVYYDMMCVPPWWKNNGRGLSFDFGSLRQSFQHIYLHDISVFKTFGTVLATAQLGLSLCRRVTLRFGPWDFKTSSFMKLSIQTTQPVVHLQLWDSSGSITPPEVFWEKGNEFPKSTC